MDNNSRKFAWRTRGYRCAAGSRDVTLYLVEQHSDKYKWEPPQPGQRFRLPPVSEQISGSFEMLEGLICSHVEDDEQERYFYAIHHLMRWASIYSHHETDRQNRRNGTRKAVQNRRAVKFETSKKEIINALADAHWASHPEDNGGWVATAKAIHADVKAKFLKMRNEGHAIESDMTETRLATRIREYAKEKQGRDVIAT